MKNKPHWIINLVCFLLPIVVFHLCLYDFMAKDLAVGAMWFALAPYIVIRRFPVAILSVSFVAIALHVSKRIRFSRRLLRFGQAVFCFIVGLTVGAMWFGNHLTSSDVFPLQD
jgi:hypothetical protein